jgi:glycosyltransferase involved in cell wall biosynthesis
MYASAEVAVSPSVFEGFGFPAAEAMACGLPLVAAKGGALPEVVGDAGRLVPTRNAHALATAINILLGDAGLRQRLGQAARVRVQTKFRWEDAVRRLLRVYIEMIDAHG